MTMIRTAHGIGEVVETESVHGRTSYRVKGAGFDVWVDAAQARVASDEGDDQGNLFAYQYQPYKDPKDLDEGAMSMARGANIFSMGSSPFNHDPASNVWDNSTTLPYDPTPQNDTRSVPGNESSWGPGEYEFDGEKRLHPSDSLSFDHKSEPSGPGPSPSLFATGAYSVTNRGPQHVAAPRYPHPGDEQDVGWDLDKHYTGIPDNVSEEDDSPHHPGHWGLQTQSTRQAAGFGDKGRGRKYEKPKSTETRGFPESSPAGPDDREYPRQRKDPAKDMPKLRIHDTPVFPFDKVSPSGGNPKEMGSGDEPDWYSCPDCGAWHNPFRHMHDRRKARPPRSDDAFQPAYKGSSLDVQFMVCASCHEAEGRHRAPPNEDPFIDTLDRGALPELTHDPGDDEHVFMKKTWPPKQHGDHFAGLAFPTDMPDKFAYIPSAADYEDPTTRALAAIERQATICEGEYPLDQRVGQLMHLADHDKEYREAAWRDVQSKAKRLRSEGRVSIKEASPEAIYATVQGDNGTYDTIIVRGNVFDLGGQSVTSWHCGCDWGKWAFKRRLTYVGRFCSHAYATYMEMRSAFDQPGTRRTRVRQSAHADPWSEPGSPLYDNQLDHITPVRPQDNEHLREPDDRYKSAGVVDEFKSWAKDNDQPTDESGIANFVSLPTKNGDDDKYTEDEVNQLYNYVQDNRRESPQREFDVPYTFDYDRVYKQSDVLTTQPRSLTPDLQFVPEGEPEHLVDVEADDRKTTGPGQIMTDKTAAHPDEGHYDDYDHAENDWEHQDAHEGDDEIKHFAGLKRYCDESRLPYPRELIAFMSYAEEQKVTNPTPGGPSNPRPDAGESTRDLNKLRKLIQEPLSDSFGHMDDRNDDVRDLVDELHDGGVGASNLVASLQFEADGGFMDQGDGGWADLPFAGSGPDPKWWHSTSEDYINDNERPRFQDVTNLPDGDIYKYNDSDSPVTSPKSPDTAGSREGALFFEAEGGVFSDETSSMAPMGGNVGGIDPGDTGGGDPLMSAGDVGDDQMTASLQFEADMFDIPGGGNTITTKPAGSGDTMSIKPPSGGSSLGDAGHLNGNGNIGGDAGHLNGSGNIGGDAQHENPGILPPGMSAGDTQTTKPPGGGSYTVQPGDNLSDIAQSHGLGGDWQSLVNSNPGNIGGEGTNVQSNPNLIHPGDQLNIPGAGAGDMTSPGGGFGAGAADFSSGAGSSAGAGKGDYVSTPAADQVMSAGRRPSIRDSIERRQLRHMGYDQSTLPPGWGSNPSSEDYDDDPIQAIPGGKEVQQMMPDPSSMMPGGGGKGGGGGAAGEAGEAGALEELPLIAASRYDESDIVRQFQSSQAGQQFARGGRGPAGPSSRSSAMAGASVGRQGGRGNFSDGDIAGAASNFLTRTAGRNYSPAEQADLMNEYHPQGARNLAGLDLTGTHYEA